LAMPEPADIMVICADPDDPEFGVGGSVARWVGEGKKVVYVICTNGDKGSSDPAARPVEIALMREKEQLAAAEFLGVKDVVFLGYPDQSLEDTPEFRKAVVREIRKYKPNTVVTMDLYHKYIWHRDHRIVGRVVLDAIFPFARDIHAYPDMAEEGLEPHKVREILVWGSDEPNYRIDVTDYFETKMAALSRHVSQVGAEIGPEMRKRIAERARVEAGNEGFELGECYYRIELLR